MIKSIFVISVTNAIRSLQQIQSKPEIIFKIKLRICLLSNLKPSMIFQTMILLDGGLKETLIAVHLLNFATW